MLSEYFTFNLLRSDNYPGYENPIIFQTSIPGHIRPKGCGEPGRLVGERGDGKSKIYTVRNFVESRKRKPESLNQSGEVLDEGIMRHNGT